ncbi:MAG TPA: cytidine deaminase [Candidatus Dormibacteraeota bacterium]|nr:cytidine deaminase [Candidatus Dormibacteraeota bacterium]
MAIPPTTTSEALSEADRALWEAARGMTARAYAPYSKFRVGAALRTVAGGFFTGCNVENGSYAMTLCAERNAVFGAVAAEGPGMRVETIAIYADAEVVSPCGACRQVLAELGPGSRVIFPMRGLIAATTIELLQPVPFELERAEH